MFPSLPPVHSIPFLSPNTHVNRRHDLLVASAAAKADNPFNLARFKFWLPFGKKSDSGPGSGTAIDTKSDSKPPLLEGPTTPSKTTTTTTTIPATSTTSSDVKTVTTRKRAANCANGMCKRFPFEGVLYDDIGPTNFVDIDKYQLMMSLQKSIPLNKLSTLLDTDLPAKVSLSGKLCTFGSDGLKMNPLARIGFNLRLLDLGASDTRQKGFLRFKASARTDGRIDHGFEIDRKAEILPSMPQTMLYGNVMYKTSNRNVNGEWKTVSSFGLHQDFRLFGIKLAARAGLTPEGKFVYDLKL